jgi:probable F420-dependent oxidoreductase
MREFRFGFTLATHDSQSELAQTCETARSYGYDTAVAVDHLGTDRSAPFQTALAAALATGHLRVGTFVLNIGLWNPTVLAREVATAVRLTGGRFELGLGAGTVKAQFDAAGIPWHDIAGRMDQLETAISTLRDLLARERGLSPPRLLIGGTSQRALRISAEHADIASFGGRVQVPGQPFGTLRLLTAEETTQRMESFRSLAGPRLPEIELNAFIIDVEVTDDRRAAAERIAADDPGELTPEQALHSPFLLIGTEEEIARQILQRRERYGFSYFTVQRHHMAALGPAIKRVHGHG